MIDNITNEQWKAQLETDALAVVLDVRTEAECMEGVLKNATEIDFLNQARFLQEVAQLDKTKHYYIYCRSGNRSGQACHIMNQMGFAKTFNLMGGMMQWDGDVVRR